MKLMEIKLEDMRPDPNNPRDDFGDLKAMAKTFELTPGNPGEPLNPPVVVEDGEVYRIIDGERRYRAMMLSKRENCNAIVCDDVDEANSLIAMLATDDKAPLSELERSRGVQQMLMLGIPETQIESAAQLKAGTAKKIRGGMNVLGKSEAQQMSLGKLIAIEELRDAGANDDELAIVIDSSEPQYEIALNRAIRAVETRHNQEDLRACFSAQGIEVIEQSQMPDDYSYHMMLNTTDEATEYIQRGVYPDDIFVWDNIMGAVDIYRPNEESETVDESKKLRDIFKCDAESGAKRRLKWYADCLRVDTSSKRRTRETPVLDRMIEEIFVKHGNSDGYEYFCRVGDVESADIILPETKKLNGKSAAVMYRYASRMTEAAENYHLIFTLSSENELDDRNEEYAKRFIDWMDAFEVSGYVLDDADKRVVSTIEMALGIDDSVTEEDGAGEDTSENEILEDVSSDRNPILILDADPLLTDRDTALDISSINIG